MRFYISGDNGTRCNHAVGTEGDAWHDGGVGTDGTPLFDNG